MYQMSLPTSIKKLIVKDPRIIAVLLFGSTARGEPHRDIDLCLVLNKKYPNKEMTGIAISYSGLLPAKLDREKRALEDPKAAAKMEIFDISVFQQLPLYIRQHVLKDGKILLCKDIPLLYDIAFQTIREFNLYEKIYTEYLEELEKKERVYA